MELNVTNTYSSQFENREYLKNRARDILSRQGASKENLENILEKTIFAEYNKQHADSQLAVIKASAQITLNKSFTETAKYLNKTSVKKPAKEPVLGELWEIFTQSRFDDEESSFVPVIDEFAENIFAVA